MIRTGVDLELAPHGAAQPVTGKHPDHGLLHDALRVGQLHLAKRRLSEPAGVAGVAVVALVVGLGTCDDDLLGVDDHDEVAEVHVRCVLRLVLAAQQLRHLRSEPTQRKIAGVDEPPGAIDVARPRRESSLQFHRKTVPYRVCTGAQRRAPQGGAEGDGNGSGRLCANRKGGVFSPQSSVFSQRRPASRHCDR